MNRIDIFIKLAKERSHVGATIFWANCDTHYIAYYNGAGFPEVQEVVPVGPYWPQK